MSRFDAMGVRPDFLFSFYIAFIDALEPASRERLDAPLDFQARQAGGECSSVQAAALRELVDGCRREADGVEQRIGLSSGLARGLFALWGDAELFKHVIGILHQLRALLDEPMASLGKRRVDRARDREHVAILVRRAPRRDERAAARHRGLYHQHAAGKPTDETIAL